jgi:hypothetical protein
MPKQLPLTIKLTKALHQALKSGPATMSKQVTSALHNATFDDLVSALKRRYDSDDVPAVNDAVTKVIVSEAAFNNMELFSFKLGISRDTVVRLILENYLDNDNDNDNDTDTNPHTNQPTLTLTPNKPVDTLNPHP